MVDRDQGGNLLADTSRPHVRIAVSDRDGGAAAFDLPLSEVDGFIEQVRGCQFGAVRPPYQLVELGSSRHG